jgi:hypothetical protein
MVAPSKGTSTPRNTSLWTSRVLSPNAESANRCSALNSHDQRSAPSQRSSWSSRTASTSGVKVCGFPRPGTIRSVRISPTASVPSASVMNGFHSG